YASPKAARRSDCSWSVTPPQGALRGMALVSSIYGLPGAEADRWMPESRAGSRSRPRVPRRRFPVIHSPETFPMRSCFALALAALAPLTLAAQSNPDARTLGWQVRGDRPTTDTSVL